MNCPRAREEKDNSVQQAKNSSCYNKKVIREKLEKIIGKALSSEGINPEKITLEHPGILAHGDYATNVALMYAKDAGKNPKELAEKIKKYIETEKPDFLTHIEIAGPGFINFTLSKKFLNDTVLKILEAPAEWGKTNVYKGKKIMIEYTQPNPFKPFHIGHLMSNAIGESISRLVEFSGAKTIRANYQGDVGLHVAKALWGLQKRGSPDPALSHGEQAQYIGECYTYASNLYETNEMVKEEINAINKKVYDRSDAQINHIYDWGRSITLGAFEEIYKTLGTKFNYYFFESEMGEVGKHIVLDNVGRVFEESDGAIVFKAEKYDPSLHTRVFISSLGLPMYETKELGLTLTKFEKENPDLSITTTAVEQKEYMRVVTKAVEIMHPDIASRMRHITHGMMRLVGGKMSSRKGNVITGEGLLRETFEEIKQKVITLRGENYLPETDIEKIGVAAIKYSILRSSLESDIVYDEERSISFDGDSGPYLQYTATRAKSVLEKGEAQNMRAGPNISLNNETNELERTLYFFPEIVERAATLLEPHHVISYLTHLASVFNAFYADEQILKEGDSATAYRLALVKATHQTMKNGLQLLGINLPEKM
jgi:arginyl-tRNA synthetase